MNCPALQVLATDQMVDMKREIELSRFSRDSVVQAISRTMRSGGWCRVNHTDDHLPSGVKHIKGKYYVASFSVVNSTDPRFEVFLQVEVTESNSAEMNAE